MTPIGLHYKFYLPPYCVERRRKLMCFLDLLSDYDEFLKLGFNRQTKLVKSLEVLCYNDTIKEAENRNIIAQWTEEKFSGIYDVLCFKISSNLDKYRLTKNNYFVGKLISGEINLNSIINVSVYDLNPKKAEEIMSTINMRRNVERTECQASSLYTCYRCKGKRTTYKIVQIRAGDESADTFVTCLDCGNHFKVHS